MKKILLVIFSFQFSALCFQSTSAQSTDTLRKEIPEVIVTATRTKENPQNVARSVTVLKQEEIKKLQSNDLAQLLSVQQGISVTGAVENPGMTETIFMRGTNSNHTLLMIDGVRISDPSTVNDALDLTEIPVSGFSQVEIVRGSHSTLYGSSSMGGVINLISTGKKAPGFHADVAVRSGTFGAKTFSIQENIQLNYSWKNGFYANLDFFDNHVNGLDATVDTITNPNAFKSFDRDDLNLLKGTAKIGFENAKWNVFASYGFTQQHTDYDKAGWKYNNPYGANPLAYYDGDSTKILAKRNLFTYNASHDFSKSFELSLNGGYTALKRDAVDDSSVVDNAGTSDQTFSSGNYSGSNMNHDLQATLSMKNIKLIGGAEWLRETMTFQTSFYTNGFYGPFISITNLDSLNLHDDLYSGFAQADIDGKILSSKLSSLHLIAGTRYNHHDLFGNAFNYEINPSYRFGKDALLYASFSSGFNAPSLYQLYSPETYYTSGITRGNPTLQAEISHSVELGFKQNVSAHFQFEVALYRNVIDHEIEYVYLWDKNIPVDSLGNDFSRDDFRGDTYLNAGKLVSKGIEFSFSSQLTQKWKLNGNLNFVNGKLIYDPSEIDTTHTDQNQIQLYSNGAFPITTIETTGLTRRPSTANISLIYEPVKKISLQLMSRWIGEHSDIFYDSNLGPYGALNTVPINDYVLFDFIGNCQLNNHFNVALKVENILNTAFVDLRGFTSRGRGVYLTLRASF